MWQGIPFKLLQPGFVQHAVISIEKLPPVLLQSPTDLSGAILTGIATLIGGAIPALIALKAIKANKEMMFMQQKIINRQSFIDDLRMKMSIFISDATRICIYVERHLTNKGLTLAGAPEEIHNKILDFAYQLDLQYNFVEILVGGNENFDDMLSLMKEISEKFLEHTEREQGFNIHPLVDDLGKKTRQGISKEWHAAFT